MTMFAQHGYGKSDKIEDGLSRGFFNGVILSPRDESPDKLAAFATELRNNQARPQVLFDPQFYVSNLRPVKDGDLPAYPYYHNNLTRRDFSAPTLLASYVRDTIDYQLGIEVTRVISPTILVDSFRDPWSQIGLSMAHESCLYHSQNAQEAPPLLISLVVDETALKDTEALDEYMDMLSLLEVKGFYIIVRRSSHDYSQFMDEQALANLLYMCYSLGKVNQYELVFGYTDMVSLLLHATGATACATGWFNGLRQFTFRRFQPSSGGQRAKSRYTSMQLLNSILVIPELSQLLRLGAIGDVTLGSELDRSLRTNPGAPWPDALSFLHHCSVLSRLTDQVNGFDAIDKRLGFVLQCIEMAKVLYRRLDRIGAQFGPKAGPDHLRQWENAISIFRDHVKV